MDPVLQTPPAADVHCIREVRVGMPLERQEQAVQFYTELLGLPTWPQCQQIPGGLGLGDPERGLYLQHRHDPNVDPMQRRFTVIVDSLDELEKRLSEQSWPFVRYHGFSFTDQRVVVADPVGHLVEVRQLRPAL